MTTNEITGDTLRSKATSERYRENFDAIYRAMLAAAKEMK